MQPLSFYFILYKTKLWRLYFTENKKSLPSLLQEAQSNSLQYLEGHDEIRALRSTWKKPQNTPDSSESWDVSYYCISLQAYH